MLYLLYLISFTLILLGYFRLADHFNIVDRPNHRSSHKIITIRGGGIIFPIAFLIHFAVSGFEYSYFILGLFTISVVSLLDDIRPLSNKIRILGHLTATSCLFYQAEFFDYSIWIVLVGYILVIGTINAYNFMDGINGITAAYSIITVSTLWYLNLSSQILEGEWFGTAFIVLLVFGFFNFRRKAKCFAGDVGSVSIAFILTFFILLLIIETNDLKYIGFFVLYGLDTISTIIFRLIRKENIFEAHRSHFYQYLANSLKWPHLAITTLYMVIQGTFNVLIIWISMDWVQLLLFITTLGVLFVGIRYLVEGRVNLLGEHYSHPNT